MSLLLLWAGAGPSGPPPPPPPPDVIGANAEGSMVVMRYSYAAAKRQQAQWADDEDVALGFILTL